MTSQRTFDARTAVALPVGAAMGEVETSINQSMVKVGELIAHIGRARLDRAARMPLSVGMAAVEKAVEIVGSLSAAYRFSVEAHEQLSVDKEMLGLQVVSFGDISNTFSHFDERRMAGAQTEIEERLRIVA